MTDRQKLVTLIRLRDALYFGVQPTLRQCGFALDIIQDLADEGLIRLGNKGTGEDLDRYFIEGISPAGFSFIAQQQTARTPS